MGKLTILKVRKLVKAGSPGRFGDGGCLYLRVAPGGSAQWVVRIRVHGRQRDYGLGPVELVTLAEARIKAFEMRKVARIDGNDPRPTRKAKVPTFRQAAEKTHKANLPNWKNDKHAANWLAAMQRHVFPTIGSLPVDKVSGQDVLRVLKPLWNTQPDLARRLRQRIRSVLGWAMAHGFIEANAAGEGIDGALPKQRTIAKHFKALPHGEVQAALELVDKSGSSPSVKLLLRFGVYTAARSGEARGARWTEVDMAKREWRVPAERMKSGKEHRVPLSDAAVRVLLDAKALDDGSGLVFPSPQRRGCKVSDMTLTKIFRKTGLASRATVHGFRSSFRDWCAETGQPRQLAEAALAHAVGGVEGAYFRSDLIDARRVVMTSWADYLSGRQPVAGGFSSWHRAS